MPYLVFALENELLNNTDLGRDFLKIRRFYFPLHVDCKRVKQEEEEDGELEVFSTT